MRADVHVAVAVKVHVKVKVYVNGGARRFRGFAALDSGEEMRIPRESPSDEHAKG